MSFVNDVIVAKKTRPGRPGRGKRLLVAETIAERGQIRETETLGRCP
jgi:hypothetical protein